MIVQSTTLDTEEKVIAIYGGIKWVKIEGRFLLGHSSSYAINSTGGEATHTLTVGELPAHSHIIPSLSGSTNTTGGHSHGFNGYTVFWDATSGTTTIFVTSGEGRGISPESRPSIGSGFAHIKSNSTNTEGSHSHSITTNASNTDYAGGSSSHNNMPPYKVVYIWERTK